MTIARRCAALAAALSLAAAHAAEPALPREAVTLSARDAEPVVRAEITLTGADDPGRSPDLLGLPLRGRSGAVAQVAGGAADGLRWAFGGSVADLHGQRSDLDGTSLSLPLGPGRLYASVERRHWGPPPFGSLILDGGARALPAIGWRKTSAQTFEWPGLAWVGPWRTDFFAGTTKNDVGPGGVKLLGWRLEIEPVQGLVLGGSRTIQWGGQGRPQTPGNLLRAIAGLDNFETTDPAAEPGNQLAGFDARWTLPWGAPWQLSLHGQAIGEDEAGRLPSLYLASGGAEVATRLDDGMALRLVGEVADTMAGRAFSDRRPGTAYRHPLYPAGYRHRNELLGHPVGPDARLASVALAAQRGGARVLLMAHRGDQGRRGLAGDWRIEFDTGLAIGLAASQWHDAAGRERGLQLRIEIPLSSLRATPAARSASPAGSS
jgi:hypothetical protein